MSQDESKKPPYKRHPGAVVSLFLLFIFGFLYGVLWYFDYVPNIFKILLQPVVGITIGLTFLLILVVGVALWYRKSGGFGSVERADQLSKHEADVVATRYHRNRGFLARRTPLDGVDFVQSGSSESDDYARIYEKVIKPKTDSNRKCILINLEQSISVDINDGHSVDEAIKNLNDGVFFSEDGVEDFHKAREDYKKNLAGSSPGETVIEEKPDGSVIRKNVSERKIQEASQNQENEIKNES